MSSVNSSELLIGKDGVCEFLSIVGITGNNKQRRLAALSESYMPFKVTRFYANLIAMQEDLLYKKQMINIVLPPVKKKPFIGRFDPYGNKSFRQDSQSYIQHKYFPTLLFHIDDFCISNCQFCYKVYEIRLEKTNEVSIDKKISDVIEYINVHPEVNNILFTGGDPAAFRNNKDILKIIDKLLEHPNIRIVRFATKGLSYNPKRFLDPVFLEFLNSVSSRKNKQVSIIAQINHPGELGEESIEAVKELQKTGVQIRAQPAIICGVNDNIRTLVDLQKKYLDYKIIPYYFTIFMPVRGVEQYALPLHQAYATIAEAKKYLNGLEKKGILLASHDFGKFEVCGFLPSIKNPDKIILKWHQAAMPQYLPDSLKAKVPTQVEDILVLQYRSNLYCIDHVFQENGLPFYDSEGRLNNIEFQGGLLDIGSG